jgi:hypothetical protein
MRAAGNVASIRTILNRAAGKLEKFNCGAISAITFVFGQKV